MADKPMPVIDGHNDVLLSVYKAEEGKERSFFTRSEEGHLDLPRAREGGFAGGFFAVFIPPPPAEMDPHAVATTGPTNSLELPPPLDLGYAQREAMGLVAGLLRLEAESEDQVKIVRTADEMDACLRDGILAAILHFEGSEPIDPGLDALHVFYAAGLRSLGFVWSRPNAFATGVPFAFPHSPDTGPGLTDAGRELVRACNSLGIMIDNSHLNEKGFWDVATLSDAPLVATHSCAHALCPTPRNLTDKQLDAIRDSNGLVGVNFGVGFLREDGDWTAETSLTRIVDHVRYIADRIGVEHVALGSDFDGARVPGDLKDAAGLPKLIGALGEDGFDDAALRLITHENWQRVLRATWKG
ncbi:MAG TPA: dipeptidase [Ktedonobacterales bacterium]|jgi:membrane dipeptidase